MKLTLLAFSAVVGLAVAAPSLAMADGVAPQPKAGKLLKKPLHAKLVCKKFVVVNGVKKCAVR